jgi:hypothetical protein
VQGPAEIFERPLTGDGVKRVLAQWHLERLGLDVPNTEAAGSVS